MACYLLDSCGFFTEDKCRRMPTLIAKLRKKYCNGDHEKCARFVLGKAKGADNIPKEIYPGDMEQAQQILQDS